MATKKPDRRQPHPGVTEGRALQFSDIDPSGQKVAEQRWRKMGNMKTRLGEAVTASDKSMSNPNSSESTRKKARSRQASLLKIKGDKLLENVPTTLDTAAERRVHFSDRGAVRNQTHGDIRTGEGPRDTPVSTGWYLQHAGDIKQVAHAYGYDPETLYSASAAMSPQNSPDNEKAAISALARAQHANHPVTAKTKQGAKLLGVKKVGQSVNFRDIPTADVGKVLGTASQREHFDTKVDIEGIAKGGTGRTRGVGILRGEISTKDFLSSGPNGGPKVTSYRENISHAGGADANVESEYRRRVHEATPGARPYHQQDTLFGKQWEDDPYGHAQSTEGILNPRGATAEDTWMKAISAAQPKEMAKIPIGKESGRIGKFVGSDETLQKISAAGIYPTPVGHPNPGSETVLHALNNEATIRAAQHMTDRARAAGRNVGAGVPSMAVQETAWTEYRTEAGKDQAHVDARSRLSEFHGRQKRPQTETLF